MSDLTNEELQRARQRWLQAYYRSDKEAMEIIQAEINAVRKPTGGLFSAYATKSTSSKSTSSSSKTTTSSKTTSSTTRTSTVSSSPTRTSSVSTSTSSSALSSAKSSSSWHSTDADGISIGQHYYGGNSGNWNSYGEFESGPVRSSSSTPAGTGYAGYDNGMYNTGNAYYGGSENTSSGGGGRSYRDNCSPAPPPPPPPPPPPTSPDGSAVGKRPDPFTYEKEVGVDRYEYVYGLKDLKIKGKEYAAKAIYVSKPIDVEGNIIEVSLAASEDHPLFDQMTGQVSDRMTSVEYYIAYTENPSMDEWHSILPEGQSHVRCELLVFDTARTATLRFYALSLSDPMPKVYKNGIEMNRSHWAFTSGGLKVQLLVDYDPSGIYTIDYVPNKEVRDPWILNIQDHGIKTLRQKDVFTGANHNKTVVLSRYPYVNRGMINADTAYDPNASSYKPMQVTLTNASIAGPNRTTLVQVDPYKGSDAKQVAYTLNVTDYKVDQWKTLRPYSLITGSAYPAFEYWQEKNKLYFSETFNHADILTNQDINHGDAQIEVEYDYLVSEFRVKMILRRNAPGINSVTPVVHDYALKFKVMK